MMMSDEQIRMLISLGSDEARLLLDNGECALYKRIQREMMKLVRDYQVQLPLNCLQFVYCGKRQFLI
jgi:hypothetical protein